MDKLKHLLSNDYEPIRAVDDEFDLEAQETTSIFSDDSCCTLSRTERVYGFVICFIIGWIISFSSAGSLHTDKIRCALLYSLGNVVSMFSTMFLYGPYKQIQSMFDPSRRIATLVYIASIAACFYSAVYIHSIPLVMLLMAIQFVAMLWYCLSFIPWGREICIGMLCG
jgi:hypothetical protein